MSMYVIPFSFTVTRANTNKQISVQLPTPVTSDKTAVSKATVTVDQNICLPNPSSGQAANEEIPSLHSLRSSASNTRASRSTKKAAPKRTSTQEKAGNRPTMPNRSKEKQNDVPEDLICCNIKFTKNTSFERHLNRVHAKMVDNDGIECVVCGKMFLHTDNLRQHQKSHKKKKRKKIKQKFICENCHTSYTKKTSLVRHFSNRTCKASNEEKWRK